MKFSIVVINHNYGPFLRGAIDSALAVDWRDKHVIVADDGSTDNSRDIIASYRTNIEPLLLPNGGQNSACNAALARARGDAIILLDADDRLLPSAAKAVASAWSDDVSKVQFSLRLIDDFGEPIGGVYPTYRRPQTPALVRARLKATGTYIYSPTSGNAWARRFVREVLPLPVRCSAEEARGGPNGDWRVPIVDRYLSMLAPFFGIVVTLNDAQPHGEYRLHGRNNFATMPVTWQTFVNRATEQAECARLVNAILRCRGKGDSIDVLRDENYTRNHLCGERLKPDSSTVATMRAARDYWRAVWSYDAPLLMKAKWYLWSLLVTAPPRALSAWAVRQRVGKQRP